MKEADQRAPHSAESTNGRAAGYAVAVAGTAAAALLRWVIGLTAGEIPPFITFYPVTLLSAALGGTGPGLAATFLTALAATFFFIEPRGHVAITSTADGVGLLIFVGINVAISLVGGRLRTAHLRLQAQNAHLQSSDEQLRLQTAALDCAANAIVITDREGAIQWTNQAFTGLTGYTSAEAAGRNPRLLKSGHHDPAFYKQLWERIMAGRVWHGDIVNKRKDGSLYIEEMTITPVKDEHGAVSRFIAIKQDVTKRKHAEEAQGRLAAIVEWSDDAILSMALDGKIRTWNTGAERMFGYQAHEVIGQPVALIIPAERLDEEEQVLERLKRGESIVHYETARLTKGGKRLDVSMTISPIKDNQGGWLGPPEFRTTSGRLCGRANCWHRANKFWSSWSRCGRPS